MGTIRQFEDLDAWQASRTLATEIYTASSTGTFSRDFGLKNQIRRSAVSAMSNIAEGFERDGNREFLHFLAMAKGSCGELRSQLFVALDQKYISDETYRSLYQEAIRLSSLISGLMRYLRQTKIAGTKFKQRDL